MHSFVNHCRFRASNNETMSVGFEKVRGAPGSLIIRNARHYLISSMLLPHLKGLEECRYNVRTLDLMIRAEGIPLQCNRSLPGSEHVLNAHALAQSIALRKHEEALPSPKLRLVQPPSTPNTISQVPWSGDIFRLEFDRRDDGMPSSPSEPVLDVLNSPSSEPQRFLMLSLRHSQCDDICALKKTPHILALIQLDRESMDTVHLTICDPVTVRDVIDHDSESVALSSSECTHCESDAVDDEQTAPGFESAFVSDDFRIFRDLARFHGLSVISLFCRCSGTADWRLLLSVVGLSMCTVSVILGSILFLLGDPRAVTTRRHGAESVPRGSHLVITSCCNWKIVLHPTPCPEGQGEEDPLSRALSRDCSIGTSFSIWGPAEPPRSSTSISSSSPADPSRT